MTVHRFLLAFVLLVPGLLLAEDQTAVSIPGGASIGVEELRSAASRLAPAVQGQVFARPENVAHWAQTLVVQRELARQAELAGLQSEPKVAAALRLARDRILADALLSSAGGGPPEAAALEKLALTQYNAAPEKFDIPEQIRASHILVDARSCEPEARARELLSLARAPNADFAALAKAHSHDPGSAVRGGDLGLFARGKMTPAFEKAAFALGRPGEISDVVKAEFGYHIIRLDERIPARRRPFEEVRDQLVKSIADAEARARRQTLSDQISATVQIDRAKIDALTATLRAGAERN